MCEQCLVNPLSYAGVLPDWTLIRARRDGNEMTVGQYGFVSMNDPTFVWTTEPKLTTESWWEVPEDFSNALNSLSLDDSYWLVESMKKAGYNPEEDGIAIYWLWNHVCNFLENRLPTVDSDPLPEREEYTKTDYSITR